MVENATAPVYSATLLGSTATYTCNVGLGIIGSSVVVCQLSGWEATPQCVTGEIVQCLFIKYSRHIPIVHIQSLSGTLIRQLFKRVDIMVRATIQVLHNLIALRVLNSYTESYDYDDLLFLSHF